VATDVPRLSATIICKDEVEKIRGALTSVRFCDEVVVVDSGSTDGTLDICREIADVVVEADWPGHVAQKNRALDLARGEWVLPLDADERVTPELAAEIAAVLASEPPVDAFEINRHVHYLGRWIDHSGWYPEPRIRLFRRTKADGAASIPTTKCWWTGRWDAFEATSSTTRTTTWRITSARSTVSAPSSPASTGRGSPVFVAGASAAAPRGVSEEVLASARVSGWAPGLLRGELVGVYVFLKVAKLWERERVGSARPWREGGA